MRPLSAHRDRDLGQSRGGRQFRDETGSVLVLFSIFLTLFLLCCAIVVDVGYWWTNAKKAQIAADACALAAAQSIPLIDPSAGAFDPATGEITDKGECVIETGGPDYALKNLPEQGDPSPEPLHTLTYVEWPYVNSDGDSDPTMVEAIVKMKVGTFFGRIVGLGVVDVERRAVAERAVGVTEVTIHAHDQNCDNDALVINGKNIEVEGLMESNGYFEWNGEDFVSGPATAGGPNNCLIKVNGPGASFGGQSAPANDPVAHPWPAYYVPWEDGLDCDVTGQNLAFDVKNEVIPDGVYCASESFEIKNEGISGNITVISPRISVNAKNTGPFAPSTKAMNAGKPLLFFALANATPSEADDMPEPFCQYNQEMVLNGEGAEWTGVIFHPCGHIRVNGDENSAIQALIEGVTVRINGEDFNIQNYPVTGGPIQLALVE